MFSTMCLMRSLFLNSYLSSSVNMKDVLRESVNILFPKVLRSVTDQALFGNGSAPSKTTISKSLLSLDAALMLQMRDAASSDVIRFGWADSSPTFGFDFLLSASDEVRRTDLTRLVAAVREICRLRRARDDNADVDTTAEESAHMNILYICIRRTNDPPAALGKGHTRLSHKCGALVHKWWMLTGSMDKLLAHRASFASFCTDLGTEVGAPQFHVPKIENLLAPWMCDTGAMDLDVCQICDEDALDDDVAADDEDGFRLPSWAAADAFLPTALVIPGALHLVDNLTKEIHHGLVHYNEFHDQLQVFKLLWKENRVDRYLQFCLDQSEFKHRRGDFEMKLGDLYEKRWSEVIKFCRRLAPLLPIMRLTWDTGKFTHSGDGIKIKARDEFQPSRVKDILDDQLFHSYLGMVMALQSITESLAGWCEGCVCHGDELVLDKRFRKKPKISAEAFKRACPMKGRNLPAMATGQLLKFFERVSSTTALELAIQNRAFMNASQWNIVAKDIEQAKAGLRAALEVKFDWTKRLPWCLAALCVEDEDVDQARASGLAAVNFFDGQSRELQRMHHPVTKRFLDPEGPLRASLNSFIAGEPLSSHPDLAEAVATFMLVPVVERYIEAGHAAITKIMRNRRHRGRSAVKVSLARRLPELMVRVKEDPSALHKLAPYFSQVRKVLDIPERLGLSRQPDICAILGDKPINRHALESKLRQILYRTDSAGMMLMGKEAGRINDNEADRQNKAAARALNHGPSEVSYRALCNLAMMDHWQLVVGDQPRACFSLPDCRLGPDCIDVMAVDEMMSLQKRKVHDGAGPLDDDVQQAQTHEDHRSEGGDAPPLLLLRVAKSKPSSWHTIPMSRAAGAKLHRLDVAVTVHHGHPRGADIVVSPEPRSLPSQSPIGIIRDFGGVSSDVLRKQFLAWAPTGEALYNIASFKSSLAMKDVVMDVLTQCVQMGAFPPSSGNGGSDQRCFEKIDDILAPYDMEVEELYDAGFVECVARSGGKSKWVLTDAALAELKPQDARDRKGLAMVVVVVVAVVLVVLVVCWKCHLEVPLVEIA